MGGLDLDWVGLLAEKYGIEDVDGLIDRLIVIKMHRPPEGQT